MFVNFTEFLISVFINLVGQLELGLMNTPGSEVYEHFIDKDKIISELELIKWEIIGESLRQCYMENIKNISKT